MPGELLSGRSILVVEDEMLVMLNIQGMLADLGCESVLSASTVGQALLLLDTSVVDAAMLDVNLNGERSFPVADELGRRGVPFMFSSGYGIMSLPVVYRDRPLLAKPYGDDELAEMFARILDDGAPRTATAA
jgi:CheY-like chemotaxis protein